MKFFLIFAAIAWLIDATGFSRKAEIRKIKRDRGDIDARPRRKSKRWARRALIHGLMYYCHKDENYIERYNKKHGIKK